MQGNDNKVTIVGTRKGLTKIPTRDYVGGTVIKNDSGMWMVTENGGHVDLENGVYTPPSDSDHGFIVGEVVPVGTKIQISLAH